MRQVTLFLGLLLAGLSALVTQVGFLLRHRGAVEAPDVDARHLLRSAVALFRSKWWTIGYALAVVAYVMHVGALAFAALSLVQAVLAGGLVVLGVVAERFFGFELERRQWLGIGPWTEHEERNRHLMSTRVNQHVPGPPAGWEQIWDTWTPSQRETFREVCGASQRGLGYELP